MSRIVIMSIRPEFAQQILAETKTVEFRRRRPGLVRGDVVLIYETAPTSALVGAFVVDTVRASDVPAAWDAFRHVGGIDRESFFEYFEGRPFAYGITIAAVVSFDPVPLAELRAQRGGFVAPQSYYFWRPGPARLVSLLGVHRAAAVVRLMGAAS